MGIRLHDVGNIFGRLGHEKMALEVYKTSTAIASRDKFETQVIAKIAQQRAKDSLAKLAADTSVINNPPTVTTPDKKIVKGVQYMVVSKAYFYNAPDEATRRNIYVEPSNNAIVNAEEEQGDFVFVSFTNTKGQPSKGWLRKKDLQQVSD